MENRQREERERRERIALHSSKATRHIHTEVFLFKQLENTQEKNVLVGAKIMVSMFIKLKNAVIDWTLSKTELVEAGKLNQVDTNRTQRMQKNFKISLKSS